MNIYLPSNGGIAAMIRAGTLPGCWRCVMCGRCEPWESGEPYFNSGGVWRLNDCPYDGADLVPVSPEGGRYLKLTDADPA